MRPLATPVLLVMLVGALSCLQAVSSTAAKGNEQVLRSMEADQPPVLDSVQTWYYPQGKVGQTPTVVLQAIIDFAGRVEPGSIRVVSTTDSSFNVAARFTLMAAFYHPAKAQGSPVSTLVQQPINYARANGRVCELPQVVTPAVPPKC
ncbi:MAG: energy transducer TonB [Gemmatimonadetes bacterium]|nr:energy transducer TonB [Gemmatimonadota bacterium]